MPDSPHTNVPSIILRFLLQHLGEIVLAFGVIVVIGLAAFSYRMLYQTFTEAQAIAVLRTQVAVEDFDRTRFERIQGLLEARRTKLPIATTILRDPFAFPTPASASSRQPSRSP